MRRALWRSARPGEPESRTGASRNSWRGDVNGQVRKRGGRLSLPAGLLAGRARGALQLRVTGLRGGRQATPQQPHPTRSSRVAGIASQHQGAPPIIQDGPPRAHAFGGWGPVSKPSGRKNARKKPPASASCQRGPRANGLWHVACDKAAYNMGCVGGQWVEHLAGCEGGLRRLSWGTGQVGCAMRWVGG